MTFTANEFIRRVHITPQSKGGANSHSPRAFRWLIRLQDDLASQPAGFRQLVRPADLR
jgi:hypothetical protein